MKFILILFVASCCASTANASDESNDCTDVICTTDYKPICAGDRRDNELQFSNQCEFEKYNCINPNDPSEFIYDGECNDCVLPCDKEDDFIYCARDANGSEMEFGSICEMRKYNCLHVYNKFRLSYYGECRQTN